MASPTCSAAGSRRSLSVGRPVQSAVVPHRSTGRSGRWVDHRGKERGKSGAQVPVRLRLRRADGDGRQLRIEAVGDRRERVERSCADPPDHLPATAGEGSNEVRASLIGGGDTQHTTRRTGGGGQSRPVLPAAGSDQQTRLDSLDTQHEVFQQRVQLGTARGDRGREQPEATLERRDQGDRGRRGAVIDGEEGERDRAHWPMLDVIRDGASRRSG